MSHIPDVKDFRFKDTSFASLMTKRIYNVLLIATPYDSFILEDDGRIDELIFNEYVSLNLSNPPRFKQVRSVMDALQELRDNHYELIIQMPNMDEPDVFAISHEVKLKYQHIPFVVLTPFSKEVSKRLETENLRDVDYVFSWLGNSDLLLAIIKLMEDAMNVEVDTQSVGVQVILLVEDSIRFYSSVLPVLFKIVLEESKEFSKEALNDHQRMLRMRGRPKVMLARTFEEATDIYNLYKDNILGVISDMSFMHNGVKDMLAGYELGKWLKIRNGFLPIVYTSSECSNKKFADELGCSFIDKSSKSFPIDLKKQVKDNFGFGDFVIIDPVSNKELMRFGNLKEIQKGIFNIPAASLRYHMSHHHFARFFYSRALFPLGETLRKLSITDFDDLEVARKVIYDSIIKYRRMKNSGIVAVFDKDRFDEFSNFARIGNGSIGGKGRSIAFADSFIKRHSELNVYDNFPVKIPRTVVLCTDIFDEFMNNNDLYPVALSDLPDVDILDHFLKAILPDHLLEDLAALLEVIRGPLAVRSSSLLEDSHYQPFAGVYKTYMIPNNGDRYESLLMLCDAIKSVYASVFYQECKTYMAVTQNLIDQEKMAIVLQEAIGSSYGSRFYPTMSGVARSLNFYPIGNEKAEEGIVNMVLGLGKYIVDGGVGLRFSPFHPHNIVQLSCVDYALKDTQRYFLALDLCNKGNFKIDDSFNYLKLTLKDAEQDDAIRLISSTYIASENMVYDGYCDGGRKIISFAGILQHDLFPLSKTLQDVLNICQSEMGRAVEIEFAVNLSDVQNASFYVLQIRPIVQNKEFINEDLREIIPSQTILFSDDALGHGVYDDVYDIVYVKSDGFNAANNPIIAAEIDVLNREFLKADKNYVLVGPGRWGSSDPWLGIPVNWSQISNARVLVEVALDGYRIEPSQGTHFFQNLTSFGVGYFSVNPFIGGESYFNEEYLNGYGSVSESEFLRHVRFENPIVIKINGRNKTGVVLKPDYKIQN